MINPFPSDDVLLDRGRYATLASQRRLLLKLLRDDMEALANYARRILRAAEDIPYAQTELTLAEERLTASKKRLATLWELEPQIAQLKPLAWGADKETE